MASGSVRDWPGGNRPLSVWDASLQKLLLDYVYAHQWKIEGRGNFKILSPRDDALFRRFA